MSSKSDRLKRSHRSRSRSRSPHKKERSYRSEKHENYHKRGATEEVVQRKIKTEPADKGYRKYENPSRWAEEQDNQSRQDHGRPERDRHRDRRDRRPEQEVQIKQERERNRNDERRREHRQQRGDGNPFQSAAATVAAADALAGGAADSENAQAKKEGPNFGLSGALTEDTNTFRGIVIKYNEPPEARKPKLRWRLYVFKGEQELPTLYIHRQSAFLLGRERLIADIPIDHPSCSKQHAVIQYRLVEYDRDDGTRGKRVRPYIIDLESANGTFLNNKQIDPKRFYELQEKDVLKFGFSSREYVVLHEKVNTAELEDEGTL
ncbi:smad nuclear-interacting protein 1-like [Diadema antillarum]|uniref:smad nuclear-interacting protein 1-like n=1 Tax=Diadema antillarum TaxID=105358 RepID=UPI003A87A49A